MRSSISNSLSRCDSITPIEYEIEALSSIYNDQLEKISSKPIPTIKIFLKPNPLIHGKEPICWVKLLIKYNEGYPKIIPEIEIFEKYNITKQELEVLNEGIDNIAIEKSEENSEMVYDICRFIEKFLDDKSRAYDPKSVKSPTVNRKLTHFVKFSPQDERPLKNLAENKIFPTFKGRKLSLDNSSKMSSEMNSELRKDNVKYIRKFINDEGSYAERDSDIKKMHSSFMDNKKTSDYGNLHKNESSNSNDLKYAVSGGISRLHTDFQIIEKIGQGGGGSVYKVRHNIDKQFYAIKKIKLHTRRNPEKILKEVMLLSRLQHPNIVRYYQAWYEDYENLKDDDDNDEDEYEVNSDEEDDLNSSQEKINSKNYGSSEYEELSYKNMKDSQDFVLFESSKPNEGGGNFWDDDGMSRNEPTITKQNPFQKKNKKTDVKYLVIQMEYCEGQNLREAIDKKILQDEKIRWKVIIQIIDALSYIHRKRLIHRDIKPANIFLDKKYNVKLGDFGLATVSKPKNALENLAITQKKEFIKLGTDLLSCGIGTMYYCSPEQEKNNKYDEKTDMFSLGIVIFEMFYNFGSLMERDIVLRNIKDNHKFPPKFDLAPPDAVDIVKKLTVKDPKLRPSSHELLNSTLVSRNYNEKTVLDNLNKMIEENKPFYLKVVDAVIKNKLHLKNAEEDEDEWEDGEVKNPNININSSDPFNMTDNFEFSGDISNQYYTTLSSIGQQTARSYNFIFSFYNKMCLDIKKILKKENAEYVRFTEVDNYIPSLPVYDSNMGFIIHIEDINKNKEISNSSEDSNFLDENIMLTKSGNLIRKTQNNYGQLAKFVRHYYSTITGNLNYFVPLKIFSDCINTSYGSSNIEEKNEINFNLAWIGNDSKIFSSNKHKFKIIPEDDIVYESKCLKILLNTLESLEMTNNIIININSSVIIDYFFQRVGLVNSPSDKCSKNTENMLKDKYETIDFISNLLKQTFSDTDSYQTKNPNFSSIKDLIKIYTHSLWEQKVSPYSKIPIDKQKFKELLFYFDFSGDVETMKKKYDKKYDILCEEIQKISNLFKNILDSNINLRHRIKIDFSTMPNEFVTYSGIFLQVVYLENSDKENLKEKTIICEAGR
jgi:serine/threonine protein kinase